MLKISRSKHRVLSSSLPRTILLMFSLVLINSCSNVLEQNNDLFLSKYGKDVERINDSRKQIIEDYVRGPEEYLSSESSWDSPSKNLGIDGTFDLRSAYIDTSKILPEKKKEEFLPDLDTFLKGKEFQKSIPEIYDVSYNLNNYPKSYKLSQLSFDDIEIPENDSFGVNSGLGKKRYKIIDRKILKENIDFINENSTSENIKIRASLLKEKEEIRNKKKAKIYLGKDFEEEQKNLEIKNKELEKKQKEEEESKENNNEIDENQSN